MDAVKFLKAKNRICKMNDCSECPLGHKSIIDRGYQVECLANKLLNEEEAIAIVEKWALEHPLNTRQSEFLRMFPNAAIENGAINIHPCDVDPVEIPQNGYYCESIKGKCDICREAYWLAEVE